MNAVEYQKYDGIALAELVRRGEVSPGELLEAALARLSEVNPILNAVVVDLQEHARAAIAAGLPEGPFTGVPFLLKDITTQMAGAPTSAGSRLFAGSVARTDSALVANYRRAGLVIFGKSNTPELGLVGITEPALWGATLNPWNLERTCGGSSGGSASAVAAGITPMAHGGDGGGSIRIPASCCGVFGLKPSRGRVSMAPQGEGWGGLTALHALTRSVRDSAALLDASCRPEIGDPCPLGAPATPFAEDARRTPPKLKIAVLTTNIYGAAMEGACEDAVRNAARLCEALGHDVVETKAPSGMEALIDAVGVLVGASVKATLDGEAQRRGRPVGKDEIEPLTRLIYERAEGVSAVRYVEATQSLHAMGRRIAAWLEPFDMILLSTLGRPPIPIGMLQGELHDFQDVVNTFYEFGPNTQIFNITGQPAMSVPLTWSAEGLPVGVQFAGRPAGEAMLLRLAAQLEEAQPWAHRRPPELSSQAKTIRNAEASAE
ncbi:MAG: amidase [Caulobacteraceae bacterium]